MFFAAHNNVDLTVGRYILCQITYLHDRHRSVAIARPVIQATRLADDELGSEDDSKPVTLTFKSTDDTDRSDDDDT